MAELSTALAVSADLRRQLAAQYHALCDQRDAAYARAAPIEAKLTAAVAATQAARVIEMGLAAEVEAAWGPDHLAVKREIAAIARTLGKIPPRTA